MSARCGLAYIVNALNPGGTEKLVVEMSLSLASEFDVHVICLDTTGAWAQTLRDKGIPVYCLWRQPGIDLAMPVRLARLFRRKHIRIVHAHQCTPWFYGALSRLFYPVPRLLLEEHGRFFPEVRNRSREIINRLLIQPLTHSFVAVSSDIRARLREYEGLRRAPIDVVYNGVAPEPPLSAEARTQLRRELGLAPGHFVVGTVGRFDPIKNLPMLVQGIAAARQRLPSVRGLLVGDGPLFGAIREQIYQAGLDSVIQLTGYRPDARSVIQCLDLFVLSSLSEGTSMALLEAMAAGVPVAVTAVGGNPEIVRAGVTGWVIPSGAEASLAAAIVEAGSDPGLRSRRGVAGQRRFEEEFAFEAMMGRYRQRYQVLLSAAAS